MTVCALEHLEWFVELMPFATFGVSTAERHCARPEPWTDWLASEASGRVTRLELGGEEVAGVLWSVVRSERVGRIEELSVVAPDGANPVSLPCPRS